MSSESDNPAMAGTVSTDPSTDIDNPDNWNFSDPDDEDNKENQPVKKGTEPEKAENQEEQVQEAQSDEQEQTEELTEEPEDPDNPKEVGDDVTVAMPNGEKVTVSELRQGYLRQADYTRGKQAVVNDRNELRAIATRAHNTMRAMSEFLKQTLPPRPDPRLATTDPGKFVALDAQYKEAIDRLNYAERMTEAPQETMTELEMQEYKERLESERQRMTLVLPKLSTEKGKTEFIKNAVEVGKLAGFSEEEILKTEETRYLHVMQLAIEGLAARKARAAAKNKLANVPPAAIPKKQGKPASGSAVKNADAMRRLTRTGSMKDAMDVNF